jgi:hypothetical protein
VLDDRFGIEHTTLQVDHRRRPSPNHSRRSVRERPPPLITNQTARSGTVRPRKRPHYSLPTRGHVACAKDADLEGGPRRVETSLRIL